MKSRIGSDFELLPDTIQVANSALILIFIPAFQYGVYPLLGKKIFLLPSSNKKAYFFSTPDRRTLGAPGS